MASERIGPNDGVEREILIDRDQIKVRVAELGVEISRDYAGKKPVIVGILKGSFIFMADLVREFDSDLQPELDFMAISSYVGTKSNGQPRIDKDLGISIKGRNVLVIEDIVDTGTSFKTLLKILEARSPESLKTCALLSKPSRREVEVPIDYLGFTIEDKWVEGYGLDTDQENRHLPDIWYRKVDE